MGKDTLHSLNLYLAFKASTVKRNRRLSMELQRFQTVSCKVGRETCDNKPLILPLTTVPPHMDSLAISTKTKAGLVTGDDRLPFRVTVWHDAITVFGHIDVGYGHRNVQRACSPASCSRLSVVLTLTG